MKNCNFVKCCICLYGNECMPAWNLPNEFTRAPRNLIIQRLLDRQFSEYRNDMILALKDLYGYDFKESNFTDQVVREQDFVIDDIDLETCPFCDGPAELYVTKHIPKGYDFTPRCKRTGCCGRITKKYPSRRIAIQTWNIRIPMQQLKYNSEQKIRDSLTMIQSLRNLSGNGIQIIDTDSIFFSSYESAEKYAKQDSSIPFSKYSEVGQILFVRMDDNIICKYIIDTDRSLLKIENTELIDSTSSSTYSKEEIDNIIT